MSLPRLQFKAAIQLGWFKNPILIAPGHLWLWENQKPLLSGKPSPIKTEKILFSGRIWKLQIITDILPESSIPILRWALLQLRPKEWVGGDRKMNDFFFYCLKSKIYSHLSVQALLPSLEYWTPTIFQGLGAASSDQEKLFLLFSELPFYVGGEIDKIKKKKIWRSKFFKHKEAPPPGRDRHHKARGCFVQVGPRDPGPAFPVWFTATPQLRGTNFYAKGVPASSGPLHPQIQAFLLPPTGSKVPWAPQLWHPLSGQPYLVNSRQLWIAQNSSASGSLFGWVVC